MPVFFFLSGLLVARSLDNSPTALSFLAKRALRLYPGIIFYVVVMACFIGPIVSSYSPLAYFCHPLFRQYLLTATLLHIEFFLPGVFTGNPEGFVNSSLWSIPLEIKLYLALLLSSYLSRRRRNASYMLLAILLLALDLCNFPHLQETIRRHGLPDFSLYAYTTLPVHFLIGVLCYRFRTKIIIRNSWIFVLALGYLAMKSCHLFNQLSYLLIPMAVLYCATNAIHFCHRLTPRPDLTYGMYVWGFPVEQMIILYLKPTSHNALFFLTLLFTVPIALFSWYAIEHPALRWKVSRTTKKVAKGNLL